MNRDEALLSLGLSATPDRGELERQYEIRRTQLTERLANAPTDGLREKYQTALGSLVAAYELLKQGNEPLTGSGLSRTQIGDLPAASPSYTRGIAGTIASAAFSVGDVLIERYEIRQLIGQGGMGSVYRAFDRTRSEELALKVLLPALVASDQARERFLSEAKISSRLSHPNIVNVFDVQRAGEHYFLTMELLKGRTLRQLLQQPSIGSTGQAARLAVSQAIELAQAIGAALTYAHRFTVHRDIKPENIWIDEDGGYKLMDFGIARLLTGSQLTMTATVVGSAYYMAPEQLRDSKSIDGRADQYSLAVVIYEAICGDLPVGRAKSLYEKVKGIPRGFSAAIDRALEGQPDARFADIAGFVEALATRSANMKRILPYAGAAALVAAVLGGIIVGWPTIRSLLPNPALTEHAKAEAIQSQAALSELIPKLEARSHDFEQRVRDLSSAVDRISDRVNMARNEDERAQIRTQLAEAQRSRELAEQTAALAHNLLSIDALAALKGRQALAEADLREGRAAAAAQISVEASKQAHEMLASADSLVPIVEARSQFAAQMSRARDTIDGYGGKSGVILADAATLAARAAKSLDANAIRDALSQFTAATVGVNSASHNFLAQLVTNYALIAQKKMEANDLELAQAAIEKGKAAQAAQRFFPVQELASDAARTNTAPAPSPAAAHIENASTAQPLESPRGSVSPRPHMTPPQLVKVANTADYYPPAAARLGEQGTAVVEACIGPTGEILSTAIAESSASGRLDEAALKVAQASRYGPAMQDGHAVQSCFNFKLQFKLAE